MADPVPSDAAAPAKRSPRALGRRIGAIVYWTLVVGVSLTGAGEVTWQVHFQPGPAAPYVTCHDGLRALFAALVRARDAAGNTNQGEDVALARFRDALLPEWRYRDGVASRCLGSARDERALDAIERLRYAEEHAVRREAGELAPLRRRVQAIIDGDLGGQRGPESPPNDPSRSPAPPH